MRISGAVALAAALGATVGLAGVGAEAVTVNASADLPSPILQADDLLDPTSVSGFVRLDYTGNNVDGLSPSSLSPYAGTAFQDRAVYHSVSADGEARYAFDPPQSRFGLLYGSPDPYNELSFLLGGIEVFDLLGDELVAPGSLGMGAVYVLVSDISFDEVRFTSSGDAFEFSNVFSLVSIPLPATLPLLFAALAGFGILTRRRDAGRA
jgi:hypothetical protein